MRKTIELILDDAAHGDGFALMGLIDHLLSKDIPLDRIIGIAKAMFGIPEDVSLETMRYFC